MISRFCLCKLSYAVFAIEWLWHSTSNTNKTIDAARKDPNNT